MSVRPLPDRPHLDALRSAAKRLLSDALEGRPAALGRFDESHPRGPGVGPTAKLTDAQIVIAREYGFRSWTSLRRAVLHKRLVALIHDGDESQSLRLLRESPWLAGPGPVDEPSALHWAAFKGRATLVETLLRMGADREARDPKFGSPPVGWANEGGHPDICDLIVSHGAKVDVSRAAAAGLTDRVRELVEGGVGLAEDVPDDWHALAQAAGWGRHEIVAYLLSAGAPVDVRSEGGITPLHAAVAWGAHVETARMLLESGADPDATDDRQRTPRDAAADSGDGDLVALFARWPTHA